MENKYYIPSVEEFYMGFEFEYNDDPNSNEYEKAKFDWSWSSIVYDDYEHIADDLEGIYRVKYLDKEDIESLGFEYKKHGIYYYKLDKDNLWRLEKLSENKYHKEPIHYIMSYYVYGSIRREMYFSIKNKSELKRLLKQLGIN